MSATAKSADPEECAKIETLGIDFLAAGIGNIHGVYPANWKGLDFDALDRIHKATHNIPLVLHGGTGITDDMIAEAIRPSAFPKSTSIPVPACFRGSDPQVYRAGKDIQGKGFDP